MLVNKGLCNLCTILFIFLVSSCETSSRPGESRFSARGNGLARRQDQRTLQQAAAARTAASRIGSRPPSCINKCDSCTPCQAVQASQQSLAEMSSNIGSRPPSCQNKCNRCIPCQAVQVPTPIDRKVPVVPQKNQNGEVSVEYSNYKPEGWRCKCGNKLFNP